jgi:hypothetical protein
VLRHLYDGQHPFAGSAESLRSQDEGDHYTQTAGVVAVHPLVNQLWSVSPAIAHSLRARAFARFGYDPDKALAAEGREHDAFGFVTP